MQNKPLSEYGDLASQHHTDRQREEAAPAPDSTEDPKLVIRDGPGNLSRIVWSQGNVPIPFSCEGAWNHKGKAQEAIDGANAKLRAAKSVADKAAFDAAQAILAAKEVQDAKDEMMAEKARIQKDIDAQIAAKEALPKVAPKTARKTK